MKNTTRLMIINAVPNVLITEHDNTINVLVDTPADAVMAELIYLSNEV